MLRLSSQSKSMSELAVAAYRPMGMCTRPKLMAPFHMLRAEVDGLDLGEAAFFMAVLSSIPAGRCSVLRLEAQRLHGAAQAHGGRAVVLPGGVAQAQALVYRANGPVRAAREPVQLVPGHGHGDAHARPRPGRPRAGRGGAEAVAQVVHKNLSHAVARPAFGHEALGAVVDYGERTILQGLDLAVNAGEIYALLGANGAGKTTTLSMLLGFVRPRSGQVRVQGVDPVTAPAQARALIAYIPENVALYEHLSARENAAYLLELAGQPAAAGAIGQALSAAGLDAAAHDRRVSGFSKGMRQKVAIALALARRVPALLLDEPTSGLDPQATAEFSRLLMQLRGQGVAILMVTHDLLGAADVADRMGFIAGGRLVEEVADRKSTRLHSSHLVSSYALFLFE